MAERIHVELVVALPHRQWVVPLTVARGATVLDALNQIDWSAILPDFEVDTNRLGIFGKRCPPDRPLADGDRIELYRPLTADPKEVRRQLAELERADRKKQT